MNLNHYLPGGSGVPEDQEAAPDNFPTSALTPGRAQLDQLRSLEVLELREGEPVEGLCIAGPLNGKKLSGRTARITVAITKKAVLQTFEYRLLNLCGHNLWVEADADDAYVVKFILSRAY